MIRIAWCDKEKNTVYYGNWKNKTEINKLKKWIDHQNSIRHKEYYWIEIKEDNNVKNYVENNKDKIERDYVEVFSSLRL